MEGRARLWTAGAMTTTDPAVDFDHYSDAFATDPFPVLDGLRAHGVARSEAHGGFWVVTRYEDVREVALHPEVFSSRYTSVPKDIGFGDVLIPPLQLDPPDHTRMKKLLVPAFTPARVAQFEPSTRQIAATLLDSLVSKGRFDASEDYARLVTTTVVCQLLGVPEAVELFTGWVRRLLEQAAIDPVDAQVAGAELFGFVSDVVGQRRKDPGPDLISALVEIEVEGERLRDDEVLFTAILLVLAGVDTTWGTLATAIHHLATHPSEQTQLRDDPILVDTAREEFLRAFAPVTPARIVTQDIEIAGRQLRKGDMVLVSLPAANRDETEFPEASTVDLARWPNRHLAFGTGIHRCLGVNVARMELTVALDELLRRVPPFRLANADSVGWTRGQVRRPTAVEIEFEA
jgi:cytochrome P450